MHARRTLVPLVFLAGLAVFFSFPEGTLRADTPVSLDQYRNAVGQALGLARLASTLDSTARVAMLEQAAVGLSGIHLVTLPSGGEVTVDNTALITLLHNPDKVKDAVDRLASLQSALAPPLAQVNQSDLDSLEDILSRPPFVTDTSRNWFQELVARVADYLDRLLNNTARGIFEVRDVFILLGFILVIAVVAYFVRNLRRNLVSEEALLPTLPNEEARTPGEALNLAQRFVNAGDYRSAVRQMYLATLLILDQHGKLKFDPTLTNREYLRANSLDARTANALEPIVETFDRIWYGFEPISPEQFEAFRRRVEGVRDL